MATNTYIRVRTLNVARSPDLRVLADGRTVPADEVVTTEVCIVGAGPAGITLARELGAAGIDVVLLERGQAQWSGTQPEPVTAVSVGIRYNIPHSRAFGLGGSIHKWRVDSPVGGGLGRLREMDSQDFERRAWIPHSGWPFTKDHLRPYYKDARSLFDDDWPSDRPEKLLEEKLGRDSPFLDAQGRIRMRIFFLANPAVFASRFKQDLEYSQNVLVLTNSTVIDLRSDYSPAHVSSVSVATGSGMCFAVEARIYVLAAGGIENPRILLASRSRHSAGLGNGHDLVGRYFMEHPHYASGLMMPNNPRTFDDRQSYAVHARDGLVMQRKYSLDHDVVRHEGLMGCAFLFDSQPMSPLIRRLRYSTRAAESLRSLGTLRSALRQDELTADVAHAAARAIWGAPHIARELTGRAISRVGRRLGLRRYTRPVFFRIQAMAEQVPNPDSRVELSDKRDSLGVPIARLKWQLTGQDSQGIRRSQELLGQALSAGGDYKVESLVHDRPLPPGLNGGNHHMGTTRMHHSPREGVVDPDCRLHETENLFIAGSSVFPTGGYANPTLTILALTLRLSSHLKRVLAH